MRPNLYPPVDRRRSRLADPLAHDRLTAGIVTTRVSSEKKDANLGKEISDQLLRQPKALMIAAGVLFLMALIPGFPASSSSYRLPSSASIGYFFWYSSARRLRQKPQPGIGSSGDRCRRPAMVRGGSRRLCSHPPRHPRSGQSDLSARSAKTNKGNHLHRTDDPQNAPCPLSRSRRPLSRRPRPDRFPQPRAR